MCYNKISSHKRPFPLFLLAASLRAVFAVPPGGCPMSQNPSTPSPLPERQPYETPAVVFEAPLEVRAGTPLRLPNPFGIEWPEPK
jgi:hypothetical protein